MPRLAHEGAEDYAARVAQRRPDLGPAVMALCRHYSILRYAAAPARITVNQFDAAVRAVPAQVKAAHAADLYAARFSRVFRNSISGQRSSVNPRLTRVGARYTSSPA